LQIFCHAVMRVLEPECDFVREKRLKLRLKMRGKSDLDSFWHIQ
jgi:hypothetical protein